MSKTYKSILIALATVSSITMVSAEDFVTSEQINLTDVFSEVAVTVDNVGELVKVDGSAFGTNLVVQSSTGALTLDNHQESHTMDIVSRVDVDLEHTPEIDIKSAAFANRAIAVSKGGSNTIHNSQESTGPLAPPPPPPCNCAPNPDPLSDVDVNIETTNNLKIDSQAGGNMGQFLLAGTNNTVESLQSNDVLNQSLVNVNATSITEKLDIKSAAFGNSLTIVLGELPTE